MPHKNMLGKASFLLVLLQVLISSTLAFKQISRVELYRNNLKMVSKWNPLTVIGRSAKITVSSAAGLAVIATPQWQPAYYVAGAMLNGILSKVLKRIIREPRPVGSRKKGYGMPSSHACSLFFFSAALLANARARSHVISPLVGIVALIYSVVASSYRVSSRLHTAAQTVVGALVGTTSGLLVAHLEAFFISYGPELLE